MMAHAGGAPRVSLFAWGPGDEIVMTSPDSGIHRQLSRRVVQDSPLEDPEEDDGGVAGRRPVQNLYEVRLHRPWNLWRHREDIQLPFQAFYGETQCVWSQACARALATGMDDATLEERRAALPQEIWEYKEHYSNLMRRVSGFGNRMPDSLGQDEQAEFGSLLNMLYRGHQAWHLAHVVIKHLSPLPPQTHADLPFDLVHWTQEHEPLDLWEDIKRTQRLQPFTAQGAPNEGWWTVLYRYVMLVWVDQAVEMLQELKASVGEEGCRLVELVESLVEGLIHMEDHLASNRPIDAEWRAWTRRREWNDAEALMGSPGGAVAIVPQVRVLLNIMQGNVEDIARHAARWHHSVVAQMMFRRSGTVLGVADLANVVEDALETQSGSDEEQGGPDESVVRDLLRLDMQQAVQHFTEHLSDWWSAAHLADLLYRGKLLPYDLQFAADMRGFAMRAYADHLLSSARMWQVAAAYLRGLVETDVAAGGRERCAHRRGEALHLLHHAVTRQPVASDHACGRLLAACPERVTASAAGAPQRLWGPGELEAVGGAAGGAASEIQAAWGMALHARGQEAKALYWLSRGGSRAVADLAQQSLTRLVDGGGAGELEAMEPVLHYAEAVGADGGSGGGQGKGVVLIRTFRHMRGLLDDVARLRDSAGAAPDAGDTAQLHAMRAEAAQLLVGLLHPPKDAGPPAPRRFWRELLAYAVPLIEGEGDAVFSSGDILLLMQALQDAECSFRSDRAARDDLEAARVQAVRLALARGLSVAIQAEARVGAVSA